ncbi:MAG: lysylphosphatidylglycerol synthase transmembrane domain-containing protein, partial [Actinomycetes bacterium]
MDGAPRGGVRPALPTPGPPAARRRRAHRGPGHGPDRGHHADPHRLAGGRAFSAANWAFDLACLAAAFLGVGADVPWRGLLLAYAAAQLATNLPITPGGLGVVEGSLTIALVAFGGVEATTVAAVLVYRLLSFWAVLPVGWGAWGI